MSKKKNYMFVPNFFFVYWWVSNLTIKFAQYKVWIDINLLYEKKSSVMSLPNSTVHGISYTNLTLSLI